MTKEELLALGLTEEQIKEVFKLNGISVENAKGDLNTKETELADTKKLIEEANGKIESFKELNVEEIKKEAEDYKLAFEKAEREGKEALDKIKFEHELEGAIKDSKAKNIKAVKALLDIETLKGSNNRLDDIKKALEETKVDNDFLFDAEETENTEEEKPKFTRPNGKTKPESLTKEDFNKMSYKERVSLYTNDPSTYKNISG